MPSASPPPPPQVEENPAQEPADSAFRL